MSIYRPEGLRAYCEFETALAEEHAKTMAAYKQIECFKQ